jgi:uncharacterized protein YyaL (SSP411 family)
LPWLATGRLANILKRLMPGGHLRDCRAPVSKDGMCISGCREAASALDRRGSSERAEQVSAVWGSDFRLPILFRRVRVGELAATAYRLPRLRAAWALAEEAQKEMDEMMGRERRDKEAAHGRED